MSDELEDADRAETDEALRVYVRTKQAVAGLLGETRRALGPLDSESGRVEALLSRLAEDRFNLVVIGEFKRGKSSLINAILGRALLPTGAIPLTSVVTAVRYGPFERVSILRSGLRFTEGIPLTALADFVTERGNPNNEKGIASAEVEAPAAFLKRGLHLIDTPGVGSVHAESAAVTRAFLPEADAALFVTSAEAPLSRSELSFLDAVRSYVRKVFFVVNKMDVLAPTEHREVVHFVERVLTGRFGIEQARVFPLSARLALEAKAAGASAVLASSGLPALESALAEFLSRERRRVFLAAVLDRTLRLIEEGRFALELRQRQAGPGNEVAKADLARRLEVLEASRQEALDRARGELAAWERQVLEPSLEQFGRSARADLGPTLAGMRPNEGSSTEAYYERLTRWSHRSLAERASAWEGEHSTVIEGFATDLLGRLASALAAAVAEVGPAGAEALGIAPPASTDAENASWTRPAPPFEPSSADVPETDVEPGEIPPFLPGPAVLGRRIARWLAARALPSEVKRAVERLRRRAHGHLETCIREMDIASARAMDEERERLGLSARPATGTVAVGSPNAHPGQGRLDDLAQRVSRFRDAILAAPDGAASLDGAAEAVAAVEARPSPRRLKPAPNPRPRDWTRARTCPICSYVLEALFDFLSQFQYALATDPRTQAEFGVAGGFCPLHSWQLEKLSSPRGLSGGYPGLLERTGERVRALASRPPHEAGRLALEMVTASDACAGCRAKCRAEEEAMAALGADLATEAGRARYERSRGLCLRHLAQLLPRAAPDAVPTLVRHLSHRCDDVSEALRGYALKFDAHRQELLSREEEAAYRQAVALVAGERHVF